MNFVRLEERNQGLVKADMMGKRIVSLNVTEAEHGWGHTAA